MQWQGVDGFGAGGSFTCNKKETVKFGNIGKFDRGYSFSKETGAVFALHQIKDHTIIYHQLINEILSQHPLSEFTFRFL